MQVTLVNVTCKPDKLEEFKQATLENACNSAKEPGNRRFDLLQSADDPCKFILYEAYETAEDAAAHKQTPHYLKWRDTVADWMAEPRQGVQYEWVEC